MVFAIHEHKLAIGIPVYPPILNPSPPPLPLGCPRTLAWGALLYASNLH